MSTPEWLVPGAKAVILQPYDRSSLRADVVTIERVLTRDVVLSNGDRFRIDALRKKIGGTWGTDLFLVPVDDPRVAETRAAIRHKNLRSKAHGAFEDWRLKKASPAEVAAAFQTLAEYEASLESES